MIPSHLNNGGVVILSGAKDLSQGGASHIVLSVTRASTVGFLTPFGMTF
jgi:hypothetical protein